MKTNTPTPINENQFVLYQLPEEEGVIQVVIKDETIWATQKAMAQLFGCSTDNVSLHLKNIFASFELEKNSVTEKNSATATDGIPSLKTKNATLFSIAFLFDKSITISICKYPIYMDLR